MSANWYYEDFITSLSEGEGLRNLGSNLRKLAVGSRQLVETEITNETPEAEIVEAVLAEIDASPYLSEFKTVAGTPATTDLVQYILEQELAENPSDVMATANQRLALLEEAVGFNIKSYGAKCDGAYDDSDAWDAAIAAAHAVGGATVYHPGGISRISRTIEFPLNSYVSLRGNANSIIKAMGSAFGPMIEKESIIGGVGARHGYISNLRLDGNDIATIGLRVQTVQQTYTDITVEKCTKAGVYVAGAQNCTFISINAEDNGTTGTTPFHDGNMVLDLGARNNAFIRCQLGARYDFPEDRGRYNLVFCQTDEVGIADDEPPSFNKFYGCQLERVSQSHLGAILQSAGRYNTFTDCLLQSLDLPIVTITDADGYDSGTMRFNDCIFASNNGTDSRVGVVTSNTAALPGIIINGGNLAEGFPKLFTVADGACVDINGVFYTGATDVVENHGAGTQEISQLVTRRELVLPVVPTAAPNIYLHYRSQFYSNSNGRRYIYNGGAWKYWPQTD